MWLTIIVLSVFSIALLKMYFSGKSKLSKCEEKCETLEDSLEEAKFIWYGLAERFILFSNLSKKIKVTKGSKHSKKELAKFQAYGDELVSKLTEYEEGV